MLHRSTPLPLLIALNYRRAMTEGRRLKLLSAKNLKFFGEASNPSDTSLGVSVRIIQKIASLASTRRSLVKLDMRALMAIAASYTPIFDTIEEVELATAVMGCGFSLEVKRVDGQWEYWSDLPPFTRWDFVTPITENGPALQGQPVHDPLA